MLLNCGVGEDSWEFLGLQGGPTSPFWRRSALGFLWKEWCWSWNSSTLATSCEELTHWTRLWCWEGLGAQEEGDNRGWDGWMASLTRWTWVWMNSERWWWTGRPGMLRFMGSQRVGHDWVTELNWYLLLVTHLEPDILECKVKWPSGSITTNKTSGDDGISAEPFKIQKMMLFECYTQYISKFGKLSSDHRTRRG